MTPTEQKELIYQKGSYPAIQSQDLHFTMDAEAINLLEILTSERIWYPDPISS